MKQRRGSHSVYLLQVHLVFCTKYRYRVLRGEAQERCRDLLRQMYDALDVHIIKGVVSTDYVHLHASYPAKLSVSDLVRHLKGRSARKLLQEFSSLRKRYWGLRKRYWGGHFWGIGYGAWSTGEITHELVNDYLEHHHSRERPNDPGDFILE